MNPALTTAQIATLKALVQADPTANALMQAADDQGLSNWLNAASTFVVWRTNVSPQSIFNAITWANLTPADAADGTTLFTNRALVCQAKQMNLQMMLQGRQFSFDASQPNQRQGLQDALQNVPAGASGALLDAGWQGASGVRLLLQRTATVAEKALATGTGTQGSPGVMTAEGSVSPNEASMIRVG